LQINRLAVNFLGAGKMPARSLALAILVAIFLYVALIMMAEWQGFIFHLPNVTLEFWFELVLFSFVNYFLRFFRWHILLKSLGYSIPYSRNLVIYFSAFSLTVTPGKSGEVVRSIFLRHYGVGYTESIGAFFAERFYDLLAVCFLIFLGGTFFNLNQKYLFGAAISLMLLFFLLRSSYVLSYVKKVNPYFFVEKFLSVLERVCFFISPRKLFFLLPVSMVAWASQGAILFYILMALGYELPLYVCVALYCISILLGAASFIPGGLGVTEVVIVSLLVFSGVEKSDAFVAAILSRGLTLWLALSVGVFCMGFIAFRPGQILSRLNEVARN
jgi:uncharacterized protein (TIRG00374 family)